MIQVYSDPVYFYNLKKIKSASDLVEHIDEISSEELKEEIRIFIVKFRDGLYNGTSDLTNFKTIFNKIKLNSKTVSLAKTFDWKLLKW